MFVVNFTGASSYVRQFDCCDLEVRLVAGQAVGLALGFVVCLGLGGDDHWWAVRQAVGSAVGFGCGGRRRSLLATARVSQQQN